MFASLRDGRLNQENLAENFEQVVQEAGIKAVQNLVRAHGRVDIQHENPAIDSDPEEEGLAQEFGDELPDIAPPLIKKWVQVRLVQEKQAPAATGIQPPLPQPAQFRPFVVRERGQRFEFNQDEPNWAMGIDTIVILSDQLPINLLHGPNQNVNLYINPDFNSTNKKDRHLRILRSDGQLMGLGHTPNYCLLTFGPNSQYRTNIFFPYLPLMDENKAYKISNTVLENIACNLSIRRGVLPAPKYTNAATVHAAIPAMRDIIDQLGPDHDCHVFREFKLMTFTYGIKTSFYKAQRQKQISNTYDITLKDVATTVNAEDYTGIFISYYCKCGGQ